MGLVKGITGLILFLACLALATLHLGHNLITYHHDDIAALNIPAVAEIQAMPLYGEVRSWCIGSLPADPASIKTRLRVPEIEGEEEMLLEEGDEEEGDEEDVAGDAGEASGVSPEIYWHPVAMVFSGSTAGVAWSLAAVGLLSSAVERLPYMHLWMSRLVLGSSVTITATVYMLINKNPYHLQDSDKIPLFGTLFYYKLYQITLGAWFAYTALKAWDYSIRKAETKHLHMNWMYRHVVMGFATHFVRPFAITVPFVLQHKKIADFGITGGQIMAMDMLGIAIHPIAVALVEMWITQTRMVKPKDLPKDLLSTAAGGESTAAGGESKKLK